MTAPERSEKLKYKSGDVAKSPAECCQKGVNELKFKHFKILDDALSYLKHFESFPGISQIANKIDVSRSNWSERIILTLIYRVLELDISAEERFMAFYFAISLQSNRQKLAILHLRRCLLYMSHGRKSLALVDSVRSITLVPNQRHGYFLMASIILSCYGRRDIPPELLRISHKMAYIGYNNKLGDGNMEHFRGPDNLIWERTFGAYFDVKKPPGAQNVRKITDEIRKLVIVYAKKFEDSSCFIFQHLDSRSTWWSLILHKMIMDSLPPVNNICRRLSLRKIVTEMKSYCEDLSVELPNLRFYLVRNKNEEDFEIHISSMYDHEAGDVLYEERSLIVASTIPLFGESKIDIISSQNSIRSSESMERSNKMERYKVLRRWAYDNDCPEVLLVWKLLARIKEWQKWTDSGLKVTKSLLPFSYMVHPSDSTYCRLVAGYRFWHHYSAYIRLAWAWKFGKEQQQYDFEWYLEQAGSILLNGIRIFDPKYLDSSFLLRDTADVYDRNESIPGDLVVKVVIEGSPSIQMIPSNGNSAPTIMGVFQVSSLIQYNCIDPNVEFRWTWQKEEPILQVVALKKISAGTEFCRSFSASEARKNVLALKRYHSLCKCAECKYAKNEKVFL